MQTSFSVTWKAEAEACRVLGQAKERHCLAKRLYSFGFYFNVNSAK